MFNAGAETLTAVEDERLGDEEKSQIPGLLLLAGRLARRPFRVKSLQLAQPRRRGLATLSQLLARFAQQPDEVGFTQPVIAQPLGEMDVVVEWRLRAPTPQSLLRQFLIDRRSASFASRDGGGELTALVQS